MEMIQIDEDFDEDDELEIHRDEDDEVDIRDDEDDMFHVDEGDEVRIILEII